MSAHAKRDVTKGEHLFIVQSCMAMLEISMAVSLEAENISITRSNYTRLGNIPKGFFILLQ